MNAIWRSIWDQIWIGHGKKAVNIEYFCNSEYGATLNHTARNLFRSFTSSECGLNLQVRIFLGQFSQGDQIVTLKPLP